MIVKELENDLAKRRPAASAFSPTGILVFFRQGDSSIARTLILWDGSLGHGATHRNSRVYKRQRKVFRLPVWESARLTDCPETWKHPRRQP
jgi:hypothetical protein